MRIAFLCTSGLDYPSPRGRWFPVARELVRRGHTVQLLMLHHTFDRLSAARRRTQIDGVRIHYVSQMHVYGAVGQRRYFGPAALVRVSLLGALRLAQAALRSRCDVVHVCKPQPINGLAGVLAARALGARLHVDCDDYEAGGNRFGARWQRRLVEAWEDRLPLQAAGVTVNTRFLEQRYHTLGVPEAQLRYVPNGIRAEQIAPPPGRQVAGLRAGLGLGDVPVVAYVGTLSLNTHNVGLLIDAFARVVQRVPAARLLLVGDGEDRALLQQRTAELGLAERVRFTGAVPAQTVPAYLALGLCSVDPVADDAVARARSPLKLVESLAVGTPVVTGAVGDRAEMLDGTGGVLVRPGDADALADGIGALLADRARQRQLSAGAQERAAHYRWDRLADAWISGYN